jgi:hypothetical protein
MFSDGGNNEALKKEKIIRLEKEEESELKKRECHLWCVT